MEDKLIDLITGILKEDSTRYLWQRDDSLKHHFRMGSSDGPYIECSWEGPATDPLGAKARIGQLVVHLDERTELRWPLNQNSELRQLLIYLEQDAIRLIPDPDYHKCLRKRNASTIMKSILADELMAFFGIMR